MNFETAVLQKSIEKLFSNDYFDICILNSIGKMMGSNPKHHPNYKYLRALHCVHYSDMDAEILNGLQVKVAETLRPNFDIEGFTRMLTTEGNTFTPIEDETFPNVAKLPNNKKKR